MSRVKSPQQKKQNSYKHDRVEGGEYPHADRRNRPRAKAVGQRQLRRTAKQILAIEPEDVVQLPTHTKIGWVKSSIRLSNHIKASAEGRIVREAHNLFRRGYNKKTHAQFARVLSSWIADSSSSYSARLADSTPEYSDDSMMSFTVHGTAHGWRNVVISSTSSFEPNRN